jgi:hypothetical protein
VALAGAVRHRLRHARREEIRFDLLYGSVGAAHATRHDRALAPSLVVVFFGIALPAVLDYVTFMKVQRTAYLKIRFDWLYSIYIVFAVAVIVRHSGSATAPSARQGAEDVDVREQAVGRMTRVARSASRIGLDHRACLLGLPIGHFDDRRLDPLPADAGQDLGTAAEQLLNGMYTNYVILAVPLFILAAELMNSAR